MAETTVTGEGGTSSRWAKFRDWVVSFRKKEVNPEGVAVQQPALEINPNSGLYKFITEVEKGDSVEGKSIKEPLRVLYGDFKTAISDLKDEQIRNKVTEAFDGGNLGVILRLIHRAYPVYRSDSRKRDLASQLESRIEPFVITGDRVSQEASWQREWIHQEASWDQLISGVFKKPDSSLAVYDRGMKGSNLDPTIITGSSIPPPLQK